jgi:hypothetical protein
MMRARLLLVLCAIGLCLALSGVVQAQFMTDVTDPSDRVEGTSQNYPGGTSPDGPEGGEAPRNSINNVVESKYLNFDKENSGFVVTLDTAGPASLSAIILTTANDSPDRDPASVTIMGTNDDIVFDDMPDEGINWSPIVADLATPLSDDRFAEAGPFEFTPITDGAFASYMVTFPTLKDSATANSMQIGEVQLSGIAAVPEPTSLVLLLIGAAGLFVWRRGR